MINKYMYYGNYLFVVDSCIHCLVWKKCIEKINMEVPLHKKVKVVDCTEYHDFGIIRDPIIRVFVNLIQGAYPVAFINSIRIDGTNSVVEAEARLRALLHDDFMEKRFNPYMHNLDCNYGERGFLKRKIICT